MWYPPGTTGGGDGEHSGNQSLVVFIYFFFKLLQNGFVNMYALEQIGKEVFIMTGLFFW